MKNWKIMVKQAPCGATPAKKHGTYLIIDDTPTIEDYRNFSKVFNHRRHSRALLNDIASSSLGVSFSLAEIFT